MPINNATISIFFGIYM
jgi:hypothetical protein